MRPTKDEWLLAMAVLVARRATCARRSVGCVLANGRGQVVATGFNGVPRGFAHCNDGMPCPGAGAASGTDLDECFAVHAEANALLQCGDVEAIDTTYVTVSPCVGCVKLLLNTSCRRIVAGAPYAHDARAKELWARGGRVWVDAATPAEFSASFEALRAELVAGRIPARALLDAARREYGARGDKVVP